jgi:hypothetical protein
VIVGSTDDATEAGTMKIATASNGFPATGFRK